MRFDEAIDLRRDFPRCTPEALEANFAIVDLLAEFGSGRCATPAQKRYWGEGAAMDDPLQDAAVTLLAEKYGKTPAGKSSSAIQ